MSANIKTKKVKAVQQKKKLFRANEPLLSVFMWGVNYSITGLSHVDEPSLLLPEHFKAYSKVRVDNHQFNKENMPSHFKVKEYCPLVFRNLRERFNIYDDEFMNSLTKSEPLDMNETSGKSGARFLFSQDKLYVMKTVSSEEVEAIHGLLADYHQHVVEKHGKTLLPQYLAMYRITVNDSETYIVVMRNVFSPLRSVHKKYDIKGSRVDRSASDKERSKDLPTYKDVDLLNDEVQITIGETEKKEFMDTLQADVDWLTNNNLMDYSLLIGIHDCDRAAMEAEEQSNLQENSQQQTDGEEAELSSSPGTHGDTPPLSPMTASTIRSAQLDEDIDRFAIKSNNSEHPVLYYMGLIDILTHYGVRKRTANAAKQVKHGSDAEISTVHPEQYAKRFVEFVDKIIA